MSTARHRGIPDAGSLAAPAIQTGNHADNPKPAKRRRIAIACTSCRYRKSRCDGSRPRCSTCRDHDYDCSYPQSGPLSQTKIASLAHVESVEERLSTVERLLRRLSGRVGQIEQSRHSGSVDPDVESDRQDADGSAEDEGDESRDANDDPTDGIGSIIFRQEEGTGYFGPSSNIAFTRRVVHATTAVLKRSQVVDMPSSPNIAASHNYLLHASWPPSPARAVEMKSMFTLPPAEETLRLVEQYFSNTGLLFPYIHKESFLETYRELSNTNFRKIRRSWLGLLNMVLAMSTNTSYSNDQSAEQRSAESEVFFARAMALCEKQIRSGSSLEIVQFLLLMCQYLQGTERSIQTWNLHGLAVKTALQLGLHSTEALNQYSPFEREIRTRTWYGCVILDRSLSMTLGRPSSIPESYVRIEPPCHLSNPGYTVDLVADAAVANSIAFFNATINLYKIMWTVLDTLYGGNLGCDAPQNIFDIASDLLRIEQRLFQWQASLPPSMQLIQPADLTTVHSTYPGLTRFRVILTLRYLNLRVLAHRPVLHQFLKALGEHDPQIADINTLRQVGTTSLRTCIQSAVSIIELIARLMRWEGADRPLGAWWFSLYYTFNATLVLFSGLLIRYDAEARNLPFPETDIEVRREQLQESIESLLLLDKGNRMTEKCAKYASKLLYILDSVSCKDTDAVGYFDGPQDFTRRDDLSVGEGVDMLPLGSQSQPLYRTMDVTELIDPADLEFLNIPIHGHLRGPEWSLT
ncbi:hypothetical protein GQ53DRAFT_809809 [Thozetella sp. PMI_491]|nr:hypothetical protein GQ53DRAFT_809809 [Thozetella sp. PMI_491]